MSSAAHHNASSPPDDPGTSRPDGETVAATPATEKDRVTERHPAGRHEPGAGTSTSTDADTGKPGSRRDTAASPGDRHTVVAREKDRYGGIKWGSAFFGWLTATGTAVILTAVLLAAGATVGVATGTDATDAETVGVAGGIALLAVILVAYFCGGYVAGRMARFSGVKQGIAVWIWAVVIAAAVAVAGAVLGDKYDLLDKVGGFPRLPIGGDNVTTGSVVAVVIALAAALVGAVLGGLAGMRFHRRVDRAGFGH